MYNGFLRFGCGISVAPLIAMWGTLGGCTPFEAVPPLPSRFPIEPGTAHSNTACAECHPDDPATATILTCDGVGGTWDGATCLQCHDCDRPDPGHYAGLSCGDAGCHDVNGLDWLDFGDVLPPEGEVNCSGACHGVARADAAPLNDAHGVHLDPGPLWTPTEECAACHPAEGAAAETHNDGEATVTFPGLLVQSRDAVPLFEPGAGTCAGTYCHGTTLNEGGATPAWDDGADAAGCGSCHGNYPDYPAHPASDACNLCHLPTGGQKSIIKSPENHIDAFIDGVDEAE